MAESSRDKSSVGPLRSVVVAGRRLLERAVGARGRTPLRPERPRWPDPADVANLAYTRDSDFHAAYDRAQERTGTDRAGHAMRRQRFYTLVQLLRSAPPAGEIAEAGCWRGTSTYLIAEAMQREGRSSTLHVFDSFEGLSEIGSGDLVPEFPYDAESIRRDFACSLERVEKNLSEFPFVRFYKGWIPERFAEVEDRRFAFVHVDVDLYQPTRDTLAFFYPRLVPGGIMVLDDYGSGFFAGARGAIEEFVAECGVRFFVGLTSAQAFLVKGS